MQHFSIYFLALQIYEKPETFCRWLAKIWNIGFDYVPLRQMFGYYWRIITYLGRNAYVLNKQGKCGAYTFLLYIDIVIFALGYFILPHPVHHWSVCSRRFVVEETRLAKKLYITDIQSSDVGSYWCRAARDGDFQAEKEVSLAIFSNYLLSFNVTTRYPIRKLNLMIFSIIVIFILCTDKSTKHK